VLVEVSTRKREIGGNGGKHHEKLGHKRISCVSQLTIPDTAGEIPDPAGNDTNTKFSKPNRVSHTPHFS